MIDFVTITSQGQISIPATMRKELGLETGRKLSIKMEGGKVTLEPAKDLMDMAGRYKIEPPLAHFINEKQSAWEDAAVERLEKHRKKK